MGFLGPFGQQAEAKDPPAASEDIKKTEGPAFKLKTPASQVSIIDHEASCSHRNNVSTWLKYERFVVQEYSKTLVQQIFLASRTSFTMAAP